MAALRADAARNRDKLVAAATSVFGERGLDAPLDEIARRAGVSIGTLYNHFPTRESLFDAILPERLAALDTIAAAAAAEPDAWRGFVTFVHGAIDMQTQDRALNDALARRVPVSDRVTEACHRGFLHMAEIIDRAQASGQLRADFQVADFMTLVWAISQVITESTHVAPDAWRRFLALFLDGLRADAAHDLEVPALTADQLTAIMGAR